MICVHFYRYSGARRYFELIRIAGARTIYYYLTPVQNLLPIESLARLFFCKFLTDKQVVTFLHKLLVTDEATFTKSGVFNRRSSTNWEQKNLYIEKLIFPHNYSINI